MGKVKRVLRYSLHHKKWALLLIVILGFAAFFFIPQPPPELETQKVKRQDITQSITASGSIKAETEVSLNFLTGGRLVYVGAKKGDFVEKGQTIAALDQRSIQKTLEDDLKDYSKQRNTFDQVRDDNEDRTPQQALNDTMKRILENNQYDLDKAVISVQLQQLAREQAVMSTPIKGVLTRADATVPGVNISATTIYTVADPDTVMFKIDVDEADIGKVHMDMPVRLTLEAYPDEPIDLTVNSIDFTSHTSENGGNVFTVDSHIPSNGEYKYRIGMKGDAEIILSERPNVLTVPLGSVLDEKYVYVKKDKSYEKKRVSLGVQSDIDQEIRNGLKEGEEVVLLPDEAEKLPKNTKKFFFF